MITPIAIVVACTIMGALARHGLGGAWSRWEAVTLFAGVMIPALGIYAFDARWQAWVIGASIICLGYSDLLCKQYFGNLWLSIARYGAPILMLAGLTGTFWVLAVIPVQLLVTKWAREDFADGYDPHRVWEYVIGACMGLAYSAGPLFRGY